LIAETHSNDNSLLAFAAQDFCAFPVIPYIHTKAGFNVNAHWWTSMLCRSEPIDSPIVYWSTERLAVDHFYLVIIADPGRQIKSKAHPPDNI
jgi:hypothetical protein